MKHIVLAAISVFALSDVQFAHAKAVRLREAVPGRGVLAAPGATRFTKTQAGAKASRPVSAIDAASALADALGIAVSPDELVVRMDDTDRFGRRHVRLSQMYRGVEVDGRELVVHFGADGRVYEVNGDWLDGIALDVPGRDALVASDGRDALVASSSGAALVASPSGATLVVFCKDDDASAARLAWKSRKGKHYVFTDALTGETLHVRRAVPGRDALVASVSGRDALVASDNDDESDESDDDDEFEPLDADVLIMKATTMALPSGEATTLTGNLPSQHGGAEVTIGATASSDGKTYLTTTNPDGVEIGVLDGIATPQNRAGAIAAFATQDQAWFDSFVSNAWWTAASDDPGEDMENALAIAHYISVVLDYYKSAFERISYDGQGGRVAAWRFWQDESDDLESGFANAFWTSLGENASKTNGCFFFGYDLTGKRSETSFDTCAHELTHGITSWSANLFYEAESGALNESFSDVIAAAAEFAVQPRADDVENPEPGKADWLFDEDSGEAARSYVKPQLFNQPSRYLGSKWRDTSDVTEDNDYGGVHINSGVQNHFFYLLSEGGRGRNDGVEYDLQGIGVEKAAQIAYLALTAYCVPRTDYSTVGACWDSAAKDLVESGVITADDHAALAPAWNAVLAGPSPYVSCGENVFANTFDSLVKVGAPNSRGRSRITFTLIDDEGKTRKFSGWAEDGEAALSKRGFKDIFIELGFDSASVAFGDNDYSVARVSPLIAATDAFDGLRACVAVEDEMQLEDAATVTAVRWGAKKLPPGVKIRPRTGELHGFARKAGSGTATIQARCELAVPGQKKPVSVKIARKFDWSVAPLETWAAGKYVADGVKISVSKTGRISGYVMVDGKRVRISAKSFSAFSDGAYRASGTVKGGTFSLEVSDNALSGTIVRGDASSTFHASADAASHD